VETTPYTPAPVVPGYPSALGSDQEGVVPVTPGGDPATVSIGSDAPNVGASAYAGPFSPAPAELVEPPAATTASPPGTARHAYPTMPEPTTAPVTYVPEPYPLEPTTAPVTYAPEPMTAPVTYAPEPYADVDAAAQAPDVPAPASEAGGYPAATPVALPEPAAAPGSGPAPLPEVLARASSTAPVGAEASVGRQSTEQQVRDDDFSLMEALSRMLDRGASDLHLTSQARPTIRVSGSLVPLDDFEVLTSPVLQRVVYAILTQAQRLKFEEELELDFAYSMPGRGRFRVNVYRQRDSIGAAFRVIPFEIKSLESLGIPPAVANFANLPRGFVLVTGPTGSGKSTTLAAVVDLANRTRHDHIMTVEDPIEFLHRHKNCLVNQREVGEDTWSFSNALKHVLRQDPDIILVGEMRDLETISVALTAAETGHLVLATLHTQDAAQTIDRIIDVFPPHQQTQVRAQLAMALQGVVCQTLAKTADGHGRVVATEVLVVTPAVRNLIREGKTHQIYSVMQAGAAHGMHTLDQHLAELVRTRRITYEVGIEKCHHVEDFNRLCGRA
jgi:twitching motility protein PilT